MWSLIGWIGTITVLIFMRFTRKENFETNTKRIILLILLAFFLTAIIGTISFIGGFIWK